MKGKTKKIINKYDINQNNFLHLPPENKGWFFKKFILDTEAIILKKIIE